MQWTRCIMTEDVIVRRYIVPASSADPDLVRMIFRGRQYTLNGDFEDDPASLLDDGLYYDGDIVYKYALPTVDVTVGILSDPYRLEIESDGVLFGQIPLSKDDYLFLRVARKTVFCTVRGKGFTASFADRAAHIKRKPFLRVAARQLISHDMFAEWGRFHMVYEQTEQTLCFRSPCVGGKARAVVFGIGKVTAFIGMFRLPLLRQGQVDARKDVCIRAGIENFLHIRIKQ